MSDREAFLRAIIAAPDDDLPRMIYADYLDERGEAERAEFIRVQCDPLLTDDRIGATPDGCQCNRRGTFDGRCSVCMDHYNRFQALRRRERELLGSNGNFAKWGVPIPSFNPSLQTDPTKADVQFRRGFVEEITCSWTDWRTHADAIRAATPLRKVRLTTEPQVEVTDQPILNRIMFSVPSLTIEPTYEQLGISNSEHLPEQVWFAARRAGVGLLLADLYPGIEFELPQRYQQLLDENRDHVMRTIQTLREADRLQFIMGRGPAMRRV